MSISTPGGTDAVILVGGLGTRLRSALGDGTPKPLAPIDGHPFLWYLLRFVRNEGFSSAVLATSHLSDAFRDQICAYAPEGMSIRFSFEESPRGTAGALLEAAPQVVSDPYVAMNGDSFVAAPIHRMLAAHAERDAVATLALVHVPDCARFGTVELGKGDTIEGFREKTGRREPGWINAGVYVLSRRALEPVSARDNASLEQDVFPSWIGRGLVGFRVDSPFIDIGVPESYAAAADFFRERSLV